MISYKGGKVHFYAHIGALVYIICILCKNLVVYLTIRKFDFLSSFCSRVRVSSISKVALSYERRINSTYRYSWQKEFCFNI